MYEKRFDTRRTYTYSLFFKVLFRISISSFVGQHVEFVAWQYVLGGWIILSVGDGEVGGNVDGDGVEWLVTVSAEQS